MDTPTNIYTAMNQVMEKVQTISKSQRMDAGPAKFNFRGVDAVVNAVGPALREAGVIVVPVDVTYDVERYDTSNNKTMKGVTVRITWRFYAQDGTFIEAQSLGEAADAGDKAVSKAHSVAYRTVLLQALCIPTDEPKDPDETVVERVNPLVAARLAIDEATPKGWTRADVASDYAQRYTGKDIRSATPEELMAYAPVLAAAGAEAQVSHSTGADAVAEVIPDAEPVKE